MSIAFSPSYRTNTVLTDQQSTSAEGVFNTTTKKIKQALTSPFGVGMLGSVISLGIYKIYTPLTIKIIKAFDGTIPPPSDPFNLGCKILLTPLVCVIGPILEEKMFRGDLQGLLKDKLNSFYLNRGFSSSNAMMASRVTSVFFTAIISSLISFTVGITFGGTLTFHLPLLVTNALLGLAFGLAKEVTGKLDLPIAMHIGLNTLIWTDYLKHTL